jgi:pimeloyl-ACP methyl ester carboxylesterase
MVNGDYAAQDIDGAIKLIRKVQQVDKVNLLGWSFGTISSSRMVKIHPNWVNSLILYAPIYHGLGLAAPTLDYQPFTTAAALSDFQKDAHTQQIITAIAESAVVNQYLAQCRQYDGAGSVNGCRKDLFESSSVTLFDPRAITMPTLLVAGTKDPYINWESDIPYLVKTMPNPKNRVIKIVGASHVLMLEQPYYHLFQQDVLKFLLENN